MSPSSDIFEKAVNHISPLHRLHFTSQASILQTSPDRQMTPLPINMSKKSADLKKIKIGLNINMM